MADYFFAADTELASQSTLSTTYTAALSSYLQVSAADYIGFLAYTVNGATLEEALAIVDSVEAGQFTLADLFAAAQTKTLTGDVDTYAAGIADANPTLTVNGVTIDLTAILSDPDVAYWLTTTKKEGTIYHLREFYTAAEVPEGYDAGWAETNSAPVVTGPVTETMDEDDALATIDLLTNASDADFDNMDVDALAYAVTDGSWEAEIAYTIDKETGALTIDPAQFNTLRADETVEITFSYNVIDGKGGATPATAVITITGSNDAATITASNNEDTSVKEDAPTNLTAGGQLTVSDADRGETVFAEVDVADLEGTYGDFFFNEETGDWTYTLNNTDLVVQNLKHYQTVQDSLTVQSLDGTDTEVITVNIQGAADQYHFTLTTAITSGKIDDTGDAYDPDVAGVDDGTINLALTGVDSQAYNFSGDIYVSVTGDINKTNGGTFDTEYVVVTTDGGDSVQLGPVEYTGTENNEEKLASYTTDATTLGELTFISTNASIDITYDATNEVKDFSITAIIDDFYYYV